MNLMKQLDCRHESGGFSSFQTVAGAGPGREVFMCSQCGARRVKRRGERPTYSFVQIAVDVIGLLAVIAVLPVMLPAVGLWS